MEIKVLFYLGGFAPVGGIETFCKNLLSYLQNKGYTCTLLCWGQNMQLLLYLYQEKVRIFRSPWRWGCRWNIPDWMLLPIGTQQVQQADVVLFSKLFPINILRILRLQVGSRTRFVYVTPYRPLPPTNTAEKSRTLTLLNLFDIILVQSYSFINDLRNIGYKGRIEVIPLISHTPSKLKPFPSKQNLKIGFLGRLVEDKNIPLLLKAFCHFQEKYLREIRFENKEKQKLSLHLFGNGHLRQELEQLAQNLGVASSVFFHGAVANSEVEEAITSCHLFAFTSRLEGQCLAALEILACGRPIVATDAGALPEILADSRLGRLVQFANPENFADRLMEVVKLIDQQSISPEIVCSAYLERYEPEGVGGRYSELLASLCC